MLLTRVEARRRQEQKFIDVMRFLNTTVYSTAPILGAVMNVKDRSAINKSLRKFEKTKAIRKEAFGMGIPVLWGITREGQEYNDLELDGLGSVFKRSRVRLQRLEHYLGLQKVRVMEEKNGLAGFEYCDRTRTKKSFIQKESKYNVRPDMLAQHPGGYRVAIEYERSLKRPKRYQETVIPGHIRNLNAEQYDAVLYVCDTAKQAETLRQIFKTCLNTMEQSKQLYYDRRATPLPKDVKLFQFTHLENWPNP